MAHLDQYSKLSDMISGPCIGGSMGFYSSSDSCNMDLRLPGQPPIRFEGTNESEVAAKVRDYMNSNHRTRFSNAEHHLKRLSERWTS